MMGAETAAAAIDGIAKTRPDIVLVDIELHGKLEGFESQVPGF